MSEIEELKAELQKFKDMAKKGLEEFKDVGGCWGCGLQIQLNQDMEDIKQLKAENEKLIESLGIANKYVNRYHQTLQEIKEYINAQGIDNKWNMRIQRFRSDILNLITKEERNNE